MNQPTYVSGLYHLISVVLPVHDYVNYCFDDQETHDD